MKKFKMIALISLFLFAPIAKSQEIPLTIYHTNDLHSHLDPIKVKSGNSFEERGGYAKLSGLIKMLKASKQGEILIGVDAGDFFSGTIFSAIGLSSSLDFPEYQFFTEHGFDLTTLGNHEFDPLAKGQKFLLEKISKYEKQTPIVVSNIDEAKSPAWFLDYYGKDKILRPFLVKNYQSKAGELKVGFIGALGPDAALVSRSTRQGISFIGFDDKKSNKKIKDLANHLNQTIHYLKMTEKVDIVVLSYHGGSKESINLASRLKNLDVLIAGHTHRQEFSLVKQTIVAQTGSYGENLGFLELVYDKKNKFLKLKNIDHPHVITVDKTVGINPHWEKKIAAWKKQAFELMGEKSNPSEIIFTPREDYIRSSEIPNAMGILITRAIREELNHQLSQKKTAEPPVEIYVTSMGLIRSSFFKNTPYSQADIFEAVSIGYDEQLRPGVEVTSFYLTPKEIKLIISFMELYRKISTSFSPAFSPNVNFSINSWGIPFFNRIKNITIDGVPLEEKNGLIKVATNNFILMNIATVTKISRGFIELIPKDKDGKPMTNFEKLSKEYQLIIEHLRKNPNSY